MNGLTKPKGVPHANVLREQLGLKARTSEWRTRSEFESRATEVLNLLQRLTGAFVPKLQALREGADERAHLVYELESSIRRSVSFGIVSFSFGGLQSGGASMNAHILWKSVPSSTDAILDALDYIWEVGTFECLYAFDDDDSTIQNLRIPLAMEYYGIKDDQVSFVKKGIVTEIEPRFNPGYWANSGGMLCSIQWLNYWNSLAQTKLFGGPIGGRLPPNVETRQLPSGAIRVRLSERPGRFDDESFHLLQLECRRCLGLICE